MQRVDILNNVRLLTQIQTGDVSDAQLNAIINQGVEEVAVATNWPWLEASANLSLVATTQTYSLATLASDFNRAAALVDDDNDTTVPYLSPHTFFQAVGNDTGNSGDEPRYWTIWENNIYIHPIPSSNDTDRLTFYYYKNPTTLSTDSTSPEWDAAFHWVLVEYAKWKVWERAEYFDSAAQSRQNYFGYLQQMMDFYAGRVARTPMIYGEGITRKIGDPNIPSLRLI